MNKCQCAKPTGFGDEVIHFKVATDECAKCGAGLCKDCGIQKRDHLFVFLVYKLFCRACGEGR